MVTPLKLVLIFGPSIATYCWSAHTSTCSAVPVGPLLGNPAYLSRLAVKKPHRSEEHTSELQSRQYLVCRLLLEKKKNQISSSDESPIDMGKSLIDTKQKITKQLVDTQTYLIHRQTYTQ